jgi:2-amino-4-hydroxy-6-hydroxymethyldihydropteridine diphosphokinase
MKLRPLSLGVKRHASPCHASPSQSLCSLAIREAKDSDGTSRTQPSAPSSSGWRRTRPHPGASRTLELDLILYGGASISVPPRLLAPHPRFRARGFVLAPLAEVAGDWTDPVTGLTVSTVLERLDDGHDRPSPDLP